MSTDLNFSLSAFEIVLVSTQCSLFTGAEYKEKFNKLSSSIDESSRMKMLSEVCTFVDLVPPFRDLASKSMGSMIEMQKVQLYELGKFSLAESRALSVRVQYSD